MVMIFNYKIVRDFLLEHGVVYTFRSHHKKTADGIRLQIGRDWATDRRTGKKIADINVTPVIPIDCLNMGKVLSRYARESGFYIGHGRIDEAVSDWARAINSLNPKSPTAGWIYRVEVIGADS